MSEMVERVARALTETFEGEGRVFDGKQAEWLAEAAITAMREPTEAMLKTEMDCGGYGFADECFPADPLVIWQAMIDEALK